MTSQVRSAATIIVAAMTGGSLNNVFKLLMVKRSSKNRFMPGAHVFPGGVLETSDNDPRWASLCNWEGNQVELSFRIAAIRELFEETNVLLSPKDVFAGVDEGTVKEWREKVQKDSSQFYDMCAHFEYKPQPQLLYNWSHWITPKVEKFRYDTHFYVATLPCIRTAKIDDAEVTQLDWISPLEALQYFKEGKISLPPPTWVTLNQVAKHTTMDRLVQYCQEKGEVKPWLPVSIGGGEGLVLVLPGDKEYPEGESVGIKGQHHRMTLIAGNVYKYENTSEKISLRSNM